MREFKNQCACINYMMEELKWDIKKYTMTNPQYNRISKFLLAHIEVSEEYIKDQPTFMVPVAVLLFRYKEIISEVYDKYSDILDSDMYEEYIKDIIVKDGVLAVIDLYNDTVDCLLTEDITTILLVRYEIIKKLLEFNRELKKIALKELRVIEEKISDLLKDRDDISINQLLSINITIL